MEKGQTFPEFVTTCARAMGALVMMREDPMDAPIPEKFEPSTHNADKLSEARAILARLEAMSEIDALAFGEKTKVDAIQRHKEYIEREEKENERIDSMVEQVRDWKPPTPDHQGFRDFMLEQLRISRNDVSYFERLVSDESAKTPRAFYDAAVASAKWDITYHEKAQAEEEERTAGRNAWVAALRTSI